MFDNLLGQMLEETAEAPSFNLFGMVDINPVSGQIKKRIIASPNLSMRTVHKKIIEFIDKNWLHDGLLAGAADRRRSTFDNASQHTRNRYFYQTDLSSAYDSVQLDLLAKVFVAGCLRNDDLFGGRKAKYDIDDVKSLLERYCFKPDGKGLIIGANSSPILFNMYASEFIDKPILSLWPPYVGDNAGEFKSLHKCYTRYFDDLTFSSQSPISSEMRKKIRAIIENAGFRVNHRKSSVSDITKRPVVITGVGLAYNPHGRARFFLPRHYLSRIKGMLLLAIRNDPRISRSQIEGMMGTYWSVFGNKKRVSKYYMHGLNSTENKILNLYSEFRSKFIGKMRQ